MKKTIRHHGNCREPSSYHEESSPKAKADVGMGALEYCHSRCYHPSTVHSVSILAGSGDQGGPDFDVFAPHGKRRSCLRPHVKYIVTHDHKKNLIIFEVNL